MIGFLYASPDAARLSEANHVRAKIDEFLNFNNIDKKTIF
jgi:hypothetical protein